MVVHDPKVLHHVSPGHCNLQWLSVLKNKSVKSDLRNPVNSEMIWTKYNWSLMMFLYSYYDLNSWNMYFEWKYIETTNHEIISVSETDSLIPLIIKQKQTWSIDDDFSLKISFIGILKSTNCHKFVMNLKYFSFLFQVMGLRECAVGNIP